MNPDDLSEPTFVKFLSGMAHQALVQLGELPNPMTGQRDGGNYHIAAYTVEILKILEEKTKGNRTPEEDHYITSMIADLGGRVDKVARDQAGEGVND